jgi:Na+/melibiose symporter-like transporter
MMMSFTPAVAFALAVAALAFYGISRKDELQMGAELQARRARFAVE